MKKVLVYGATEREARRFYKAKEGEFVGERTYSQYGDGEQCDEVIIVNEKEFEKFSGAKAKGKKGKE